MPRTAVLLLSLACLSACGPASEPAPPNVLFVLIDDLGWGDLGLNGQRHHETPHIDRLAAEGVFFSNAYANGPNCAPSRESLLTGQYPVRHGFYAMNAADPGLLRPVENRVRPGEEYESLAEMLRRHGYRTGIFGKWHRRDDPRSHGFDAVLDRKDLGFERNTHRTEDPPRSLTDELTAHALEFLAKDDPRPFFLYLSFYAVHSPHQAPPEREARFREKPCEGPPCDPAYAALLSEVDDAVGRVDEALRRLGIARDTLLVVASDNGGGRATVRRSLRGMKATLYEGGIRVPVVVRWPAGITGSGRVEATPISGIDWFPTLLSVVGGEPPPSQPLDGESLIPLFRGDDLPERDIFWHLPLYTSRSRPVAAVRRGPWKLVESFEDGSLELYDLAADPAERRDLSAARPDRARELAGRLRDWWDVTDAPLPERP